MNMTTLEWVQERKLMAIVRGLPAEYAVQLADALLAGGIDLMEFTFQQKSPESWRTTADVIARVGKHTEGRMLIGAGTVLLMEQLDLAKEAGAKFIVTPNTNCELIRKVKEYGLAAFPGALTPTEIVSAYEAGADAVKVFPAGNMGPGYIKAVNAPLSHIPLMAVGGVNEKNAADFLAAGCIGVGVGGNLVNRAWIEQGEWGRITALAAEYRRAAT